MTTPVPQAILSSHFTGVEDRYAGQLFNFFLFYRTYYRVWKIKGGNLPTFVVICYFVNCYLGVFFCSGFVVDYKKNVIHYNGWQT